MNFGCFTAVGRKKHNALVPLPFRCSRLFSSCIESHLIINKRPCCVTLLRRVPSDFIIMAAMIKPEFIVGGALAGAVLFVNYVYKMPSGVLAREKTGYVPVEIQRADAQAQKPNLFIKRRPSSSSDPSGFCYTPPDTQQGQQ